MKKISVLTLLIYITGIEMLIAQSGWILKPGGITFDLRCTVMLDSQYSICAGDGNIVLISSNGGFNWQQIPAGNDLMQDIDFINENTGFILNSDYIIKTTNKGLNWTYIDAGPYNKTNIDFINEDTGFISGTDGGDNSPVAYVKKTTNGGLNWDHNAMLDIGAARDVKFFNPQEGAAFVCNRLHITTNGGVNWSRTQFPEGCFNSIYSFNLNSHFSFSNLGKIYMTVNAGVNWTEQNSGTTKHIFNSFFTDSANGYAVGDSGLILRTSNGGTDWTIQNSNTNKKLFDVYFFNRDVGIVVGEDGTILKTTTGGLTFVNSNTNVIPDKFSLSQNFPNPFNPTTTIHYSLSENSYVILKVYGILGNEITTLINERQNAGNYEVTFDGSDLSSGIYFYRLEAESFVETKRMMLLK
ncbi:MAG: T9SS type A sorting domain-containing protein [Ignavibacteria bacterium]|nr:T9SS type A sorting domain-containing protein [Ignavibacteria bacterium]